MTLNVLVALILHDAAWMNAEGESAAVVETGTEIL
jgi:hypothetical protein